MVWKKENFCLTYFFNLNMGPKRKTSYAILKTFRQKGGTLVKHTGKSDTIFRWVLICCGQYSLNSIKSTKIAHTRSCLIIDLPPPLRGKKFPCFHEEGRQLLGTTFSWKTKHFFFQKNFSFFFLQQPLVTFWG